jgi:hypothetical protein
MTLFSFLWKKSTLYEVHVNNNDDDKMVSFYDGLPLEKKQCFNNMEKR